MTNIKCANNSNHTIIELHDLQNFQYVSFVSSNDHRCINGSTALRMSAQYPYLPHGHDDGNPGEFPGILNCFRQLHGTRFFFLTMLRQHSQYDSRLGFSFRFLVRLELG